MAGAASGMFYGLIAKSKDVPLPLKSVSVEAHVKGYVLGLKSTLTYSNDTSDPVEVLFRFPIEKSHAIVALRAVIDGRSIKAEVREKEDARARYDDAIASGQSAAFAEEKSGDIFSVALGNLPPGKEAQIHVDMVGELGLDAEGGVRFSLPSTLKPRYTPAGSKDPLAGVTSGEGQQVERGSVSAVSWFQMTVEGAGDVAEVSSPTHSITVTDKEGDRLSVQLSEEKALDNSDVVILLKHKNPHVPKAIVESGKEGNEFMSSPAVMVNFFPEFPKVEAACEFVFLVDRSGSMRGSYIRSARETLVLFLKSLPEGNYFNIVGFGSSYQQLFPESVPYDEKNLGKAIQHAQGMDADLGGTELLRPLEFVFGAKPRLGYPRQIFVLTDGSVSNCDACIQLMKRNIQNARCFTFGIGSGASTALVEGLARAGNGTAEFVKEGERMQPKVILSLKRALQPAITEVSVQFEVPKKYQVTQCPQNLPPVFSGDKLVVYGILKFEAAESGIVECTAILKGKLLGKEEKYAVPFTFNSSSEAPSLPTIHHLAAKALISDWESGSKEKESIVKLSVATSVISSHTAFIAVDEESSEPIPGTMNVYDLMAPQVAFSCSLMSFGAPPPPGQIHYKSRGMLKLGGGGGVLKKAKKKGAAVHSSPTNVLRDTRGFAPQPYEEMGIDNLMMYKAEGVKIGAAPPTRSKAPKRAISLSDLVAAQQLNGSWALDPTLAQLVGRPLSEVESQCPVECGGKMANIWATVLAVSLLQVVYSSQQDEWELIAAKADSWLKKQGLPSPVTLEQLFEAAKKIIPTV